MFIPAQLNEKYLLHALFLTCFLALCPTAHAQCALRVENGANPSNVRVILSRAAELTAELADDRQKAKAFEEIAHLLSATGDKGEAFQFYECAMKACTNVKMYEGSKADDMFFRIELIAEEQVVVIFLVLSLISKIFPSLSRRTGLASTSYTC